MTKVNVKVVFDSQHTEVIENCDISDDVVQSTLNGTIFGTTQIFSSSTTAIDFTKARLVKIIYQEEKCKNGTKQKT